MLTVSNETCREILDHYGEDYQMTVAIEELSELQKELCKEKRGKGDKDNITEEIGDVMICIAQILLACDIDGEDVQRNIDYKLAREKRRMKDEYSDET